MPKRFLLFFFALLAFLPALHAQEPDTLVEVPDTVCVYQPLQLTTSEKASSYFWNFCPGAVRNQPRFRNLGNRFALSGPNAIETAKDDNGRYYAFILNRRTKSLVRLDFGTTLANGPVYTPMGSYDTTVPDTGGGMHIARIRGNWYLFVTGGGSVGNSSIARFDFGNSLSNQPFSVNVGNPGKLLDAPQDLYIVEEGNQYYGYVLNSGTSSLLRLDFGNNISNTPTLQDLGNIGGLNRPTHLAASLIDSVYRFYVTNSGNSTVSVLNFGRSLSGIPTGTNVGNLFNNLYEPTGLTYYRDCDHPYLIVANADANTTIRVALTDKGDISSDPANVTVLLSGATDFSRPAGMSTLLRDSTNLYTYVVNNQNSTLTEIKFTGCVSSSIPSSTSATPPAYSYNTAGTYYVNLTLNDGRPDMRAICRQVVVLPLPGLTVSNDTLICQGDTITIFAESISADSLRWSPSNTLSSATTRDVQAWPDRTTRYQVVLNYASGCVIDTSITVRVVENVADAGPDRTLPDGTTTVLGGPLSSRGADFSYRWSPANYLDDSTKQFPVAQPFTNYTYYLTVIHATPELTCRRVDSVVVRTICEDINLPNAFAPESGLEGASRFGLLNRQLVKLLSFRIYNRWGQQVYSSTELTGSWDGQFNGKPAETGVYVWEIDGFCPNGQRVTRSGDVTLIR